MNKYFTVILKDVIKGNTYVQFDNVEKIETTDTGYVLITYWLSLGNTWRRTLELTNPKAFKIMACFDLHELER